MSSRLIAFLFLFISFYNFGFSQKIDGKVIDSDTKKTLPFVNIRFENKQNGTTTDIDGKFSIDINKPNSRLLFSYVGYYDTTILLNNNSLDFYIIKLRPRITMLREVEILPSENPAHRIINKAIENISINKPENLKSFSYQSYNKMIFTADPKTLQQNDSVSSDSAKIKMQKFIEKQNFFIMESVSKRYFKEDKNYEEVLGSRVSGLKDPFFAILATQFQSFSFYNTFFSIMDKNYVNPISHGSTNKYFFLIQDTIYQQSDSIFVISFRPQKGKNFDALVGLIYINTDGYAVQNVLAEPNEKESNFDVKIMQMYQKIDGKAWFPVQLNTTLILKTVEINNMPAVGIGTTYLDSILINPEIDNKIFRKNLKLEITKAASKQPESYWNLHRKDSLSIRDLNTYKFIDSLGTAEHFDRKLKSLIILANGGVTVGIFELSINRFVMRNAYEKFQFGLGLSTNEKLSKYFSVGIYSSWATGIKTLKYGAHLKFTPKPNTDFKLTFSYKNDLEESAKQEVFGKIKFLSSQIFKNYLIDRMNFIESYKTEIKFRALKHFVWNIGAEYSKKSVTDDYKFILNSANNVDVSSSNFVFGEAFIGFRFAFKEKIVRNPNKQISMGTNFPIVYFNLTKGSKLIGSDFNYYRIDFQLDKAINIRYLGVSRYSLRAGFINASLPWYQLYNGNGSYLKFYIFSENSFGSMGIDEFLSDKFLSLFWEHNFGHLLLNTKHFAPDIKLENNFGWGSLSSEMRHKNLNFNTMEKGFFETGLLLDNILKSNVSLLGFGLFYRYGPYSYKKIGENFAYKISVNFLF